MIDCRNFCFAPILGIQETLLTINQSYCFLASLRADIQKMWSSLFSDTCFTYYKNDEL